MSKIIKIYNCGKKYKISKDVLIKSEYFKNLLLEYPNLENTSIELQRPPISFEHIIGLLINDKYPFPKEYSEEKDYFLIDKIFFIKLQDSNKIFEIKNKKDFEDFTFLGGGKTHLDESVKYELGYYFTNRGSGYYCGNNKFIKIHNRYLCQLHFDMYNNLPNN